MSEQIIDLIEAVMPGPRGLTGPQGPQGLPGVNAVDNDEAVASYITDPGSMTYRALNPERHMVVFGDSMTESASSTDKQWWSIVARALGVTPHKYGVGGTGFLNMQSCNGYFGQLDRAETDTGYDHGKVSLVFCNGSTNDWWSSTLAGKVDDWCARVKSMYPNAAFIGFSGLCAANVRHQDNSARMADYAGVFNTVAQRFHLNGFHVFSNAHLWLLFNFDLSQTDTLHPNDKGHEAIANYVLAGLRDGVWAPAPTCMGAVSVASSKIGDDAATLALPYANSPQPSSTYWNWSVDPASLTWHFNFQGTTIKVNHDELIRFAVTKRTNEEGDVQRVYGLDLPVCVKPYPMPRGNIHPDVDYTTDFRWWVNNIEQSRKARLYSKTTDDRLDNPSDAKYYLWLNLGPIEYRDTKNTYEIKEYSLLAGGAVSASDPSKYLTITIAGRISQPICGYCQH